jgi:hypothetical protein
MEKSKLITLLKTFNSSELKQFSDFVASPYFNTNEDLIRFWDYLVRWAPDFPKGKLKKEKVFGAVYPGQPFDGKQLGYLMNYLLKLGERFLGMQHYEQKTQLEQFHILKEFSNRDLNKHFNFLYKKMSASLEEAGKENSENTYYRFLLSELASDHAIHLKSKSFDRYFQQATDHLDEFYFVNKLKFSCEMLNRQKILSSDYQLHFAEEVKSYLMEHDHHNPLTSIYLQIYQILESAETAELFDRLMDLIKAQGSKIQREELRTIYLYAINFSLRNMRKGERRFISIALDLYLEGIKSRALFEEEYLSPRTYTNVIKVALMSERYDWIEEFIQTYHHYLPPKDKEDALHYSLAELFYHRKDYDKVLEHLNQLQFSDIQYHIGSRVLLLKTFYESDEIDAMLSLLASFSTYLRRNKNISQGFKKTHLNFCNLFHQTMRLNHRNWEALREQIQTTQPLAERSWLLKVWEERRM